MTKTIVPGPLRRVWRSAAMSLCAVLLFTSGGAFAGPFILDLTDADDHGFANASGNQDGWLYMQRVLENLAPGVTNGSLNVVSLGASGTAASAAQSAFNQSTLASSGWSWTSIDGDTALTDYFNGVGAVNVNNTGIIQISSGSSNVGGGISASELTIVNSSATLLDSFLGGGGAIHSQAGRAGSATQYGWLSTLLPGITFNSSQNNGLALTAAGQASFPGLSNSDLSSGPYHGQWTGGTGGLTVLFTATSSPFNPVGIGSNAGSVTNPGTVPEPGVLALLGIGFAGLGIGRLRRRRN